MCSYMGNTYGPALEKAVKAKQLEFISSFFNNQSLDSVYILAACSDKEISSALNSDEWYLKKELKEKFKNVHGKYTEDDNPVSAYSWNKFDLVSEKLRKRIWTPEFPFPAPGFPFSEKNVSVFACIKDMFYSAGVTKWPEEKDFDVTLNVPDFPEIVVQGERLLLEENS